MDEIRPASAELPDADDAPLDADALASYLDRVGVAGPVRPDLRTLRALTAGHLASIPFEALDAYTGRIPALTAEAVVAKLVRGRRGGWCYEQNGLFRRALDAIGFRTTALTARVRWGQPDGGTPTARSHMTLLVHLPEGPHLVDVGVGGMAPTAPLRLEHGTVQQTPLEPFRLLRGAAEIPGIDGAETWTMQVRLGETWRTIYTVELVASARIEYEMANFYLVAHPNSGFRTELDAALSGPDHRITLADRRLTVHRPGHPSERTELESPTAVRIALEDRFGIDTSGVDGLDARLATLFRIGSDPRA